MYKGQYFSLEQINGDFLWQMFPTEGLSDNNLALFFFKCNHIIEGNEAHP